ncbi:MAG TPA: lactonase family protein [Candidatus Acidoferrum sp.]|jgi:6-phosphogluconolactonase|nr:lactonase family protein [Candidatus Acidoferrum sp.]
MSADAIPAYKPMHVYFGTYSGVRSRGIYVSRFDTSTGQLGSPELAAETRNPSFLALHPSGQQLYAVGELDNFGGQRGGAVAAFKIEANGKLTLLNEQPSGGTGPCHLAVDRAGKCVLVANYGSGSVVALPLLLDGRLGEPGIPTQHHGASINPQRQTGPHAHFITADPANRSALACDLGLDKVFVYRLDPERALLTSHDPPFISIKPGSGPRHLVFHANGRVVYLINEIASTLNVFEYDPRSGALKELQTISTLPADFKGENICAEVQVHPSGRFVYASNRGHDSLAVFAVDQKNGRLAFVERQPSQGKTPRHFTLDPDGNWLIAENQDSNNVVVFRVDSKTGRLHWTGQAVEVGAPVCAVFVGGK